MKMRDGFTGVAPVVEDQPEARVLEPHFIGDGCGFQEQMTQHGLVFDPGFGNSGNGLFGDEQDMDRGLGPDILESENLIVFVHNLGRYLARNNLFE
jgi:hypothetical protein